MEFLITKIFLALVILGVASCGVSSENLTAPKGDNSNESLTLQTEIPVGPDGVCTADFNQWGNPSACGCPLNYKYDGKKFICVLQTEIPVALNGVCTADFNKYGYPSACSCPEGYSYDPKNFVCTI